MNDQALKQLIKNISLKKVSAQDAFEQIKKLSFLDLGFAKLDSHRALRKGFPEVIYAKGKTTKQLKHIVASAIEQWHSLILTKVSLSVYRQLKKEYPQLKFSPAAKVVYYNKRKPKQKKGCVTVVTAGTSDLPVAEEAVIILEVMGNKVRRLYDVGVAGIHRVINKRRLLVDSRAIIVIAGMEGALASVVGGLVDKPVIAVPTSVGYGANFKGIAPLLTMLNCCAPGVTVVNINNGFGAAYFANMIN